MATSNSNPVESSATIAANDATAGQYVPRHERRGMLGAMACRAAAWSLVLSAGIAIGFALLQHKTVPASSGAERSAEASVTILESDQPDRNADPIAVSESDPQPIAEQVAFEVPVRSSNEATKDQLKATGVTEPAPGRYAKLPLATSQAIAFVDVKPGDRVKKGWQVFSHWESPERLQAVKTEMERTKKLGEVAKARWTAATQNEERLKKLQHNISAQELQDAQTTTIVRQGEYEAAELAIAQAESHFTAMEFEFTQAFVTSPIDGVVITVDVVPGERRQLNGPFRGVTVLDTTVLYCRCLLNQDELSTLQRLICNGDPGQLSSIVDETSAPKIHVEVEHDGTTFPSKVVWLGLQAEVPSGHVPVLLEVQNPTEHLRSGVPVNVCFYKSLH